MKPFISKKIIKNLIILLSIAVILSGMLPNYVYADQDTKEGFNLLKPIEQFVVYIADNVMQWLQDKFISTEKIDQGNGQYDFRYSPAIIFSGNVPALDINFINPKEEFKDDPGAEKLQLIEKKGTVWNLTNEEYQSYYSDYSFARLINDLVNDGQIKGDEGHVIKLGGAGSLNPGITDVPSQPGNIKLSELLSNLGITWVEGSTIEFTGSGNYDDTDGMVNYTEDPIILKNVEYNDKNNNRKIKNANITVIYSYKTAQTQDINNQYSYSITGHGGWISVDNENQETIKEGHYEYVDLQIEVLEGKPTSQTPERYYYTSFKLQPIIATWYKALRRIALVGLLSVLVYVGIRIVLTSSSQDKAKYKNMLKDWLVALCLLFTLHYIMSITLTITEHLSGIFNLGETDQLLNTLRADIKGGTWDDVLAKVIMYVALVIYTFIFTFQYIKRVIFMAFFTLMAPLITLTYPLDKIKDGQAQAFGMWIREYIFNALIQVIHLIIYSLLIGSAVGIVDKYPLYAVIIITFMTQAEKIIRKMFGFDRAETVGGLGAAATGALVTNALTQLSNKMPKGKKGKQGGSEQGEGEASGGNVRTANQSQPATDPLAVLRQNAGTRAGNNTGTNGGNNRGANPIGTNGNNGGTGTAGTTPRRNVRNGAKSLLGKYRRPVFAGAAKLGAGMLLGGTGAIIGAAAGIAQGNLGAALTGAVAGGAAGKNIGTGVINLANQTGKGIAGSVRNIKDTWNEGAYGKEYADTMKFKRTDDYKALSDKFGDSLTDDKLQAMIGAGITDKTGMDQILTNGGNNVGEAIRYYTLAQKCPDEIFYDNTGKLEQYLEDKGFNKADATRIRDEMVKYRK